MNTPIAQNLKVYSDEDVMELFQSGYEQAYTEIVQRYNFKIEFPKTSGRDLGLCRW